MFQPALPFSGLSGWNFLQTTYDRQLESFSSSAQVKNDKDYLEAKLSEPISQEDFLNDPRLMRITMTAFDLGGEEWKKGFVDKVLTEVSDPESSFLARLNNTQYTRFAEALAPSNGTISISAETLADIGTRFEAVSFKVAVGEIDNSMRLALNYQSEISETADSSSSNDAIAYSLLGSIPMRTVLETTLNLPSDIASLDIEKQAEILQTKLNEQFGIKDLSTLSDSENVTKVIQRYQAMESINSGPAATAPGYTALTLLSNIGSQSSYSLFQSQLF
ncbi:MAG: DUF1217 domain-containing protein [Henriciella sp.]